MNVTSETCGLETPSTQVPLSTNKEYIYSLILTELFVSVPIAHHAVLTPLNSEFQNTLFVEI